MIIRRKKSSVALATITVLVIGSLVGIFLLLHRTVSLYLASTSDFNAASSSAENVNGVSAASSTLSVASTSSALATTTATTSIVTHIATPASVKGIYMSSWVAGDKAFRDKLVKVMETTEINAVVIDVKDSTGLISFPVSDPTLVAEGSASKRVTDIQEFIASLHAKGIYVIGRIATFQDPYMVKKHPEYAVKTKEGTVWKDHKGVSWIDADAEPYWNYVAAVGKEAYADGFDELNFDYIRFPSDGNMEDIAYSYGDGQPKPVELNKFFTYVDDTFHPLNIPISADIFGETTTSLGDLGIGQVLENALDHFDYVAPMVYPSHFANGFNGWANPAAKPYDVVQYSMDRAVARAKKEAAPHLLTATTTQVIAMSATTTATTTIPATYSDARRVAGLRPWLQDFTIGHTNYTPAMVREQIQATYDVGLNSWLLWSAANVYSTTALLPKNASASAKAAISKLSTSTVAAH